MHAAHRAHASERRLGDDVLVHTYDAAVQPSCALIALGVHRRRHHSRAQLAQRRHAARAQRLRPRPRDSPPAARPPAACPAAAAACPAAAAATACPQMPSVLPRRVMRASPAPGAPHTVSRSTSAEGTGVAPVLPPPEPPAPPPPLPPPPPPINSPVRAPLAPGAAPEAPPAGARLLACAACRAACREAPRRAAHAARGNITCPPQRPNSFEHTRPGACSGWRVDSRGAVRCAIRTQKAACRRLAWTRLSRSSTRPPHIGQRPRVGGLANHGRLGCWHDERRQAHPAAHGKGALRAGRYQPLLLPRNVVATCVRSAPLLGLAPCRDRCHLLMRPCAW